jgi:hypothetical protein
VNRFHYEYSPSLFENHKRILLQHIALR